MPYCPLASDSLISILHPQPISNPPSRPHPRREGFFFPHRHFSHFCLKFSHNPLTPNHLHPNLISPPQQPPPDPSNISHKLTLHPTPCPTHPYAPPLKKPPPSPLRNKNFPLPLHPLTETTEPQPRRATKKDLRVRKKIPNFAIRLAVIETAPRRRQRHAH